MTYRVQRRDRKPSAESCDPGWMTLEPESSPRSSAADASRARCPWCQGLPADGTQFSLRQPPNDGLLLMQPGQDGPLLLGPCGGCRCRTPEGA